MLTRKGNSLIIWVATFALASAAFAILRVPLKRAVQDKITAVADYAFWTRWGEVSQQHLRDTNSRSRSNATQTQTNQQWIGHGGLNKAATNATSSDNVASWGVARGSNALLGTLNP